MDKRSELCKRTFSETSSKLLHVIRVTSILMVIGLYLVFVSKSYRESVSFVVMMLAMYALMMIVTLLIRH